MSLFSPCVELKLHNPFTSFRILHRGARGTQETVLFIDLTLSSYCA
jgi:hypothetical protein